MPGFSWNATLRRCDALPNLNCRVGDPMSLATMCETQGRRCVEDAGSARCGGCLDGRILENGNCRAVRTCESLRCGDQNRACQAATSSTDAECGACLPGFMMGDGGACVSTVTRPTCVTLMCAMRNRSCVEGVDGAMCAGCLAGFEVGPSGECVALATCESLGCATRNRQCVTMPMASAQCGGCLGGFLEEAGTCRARRTCATLTCRMGERCDDSDPMTDARCVSTMMCTTGQIVDRFTNTCVDCPTACAGGATIPGYTGRPAPETLFDGEGRPGRCICETQPNYYLEVGGTLGVFPCDADGDGWIQQNAQAALEVSPMDLGRTPLRTNARCRVRQMRAVELVNVHGERMTVDLSPVVPLLEARRNDDQALLSGESRAVPTYGAGGGATALRAAEINSLTKACVSVTADHNANFVEDVREASSSTLRGGISGNEIPMELLAIYREYLRFAHFVELHTTEFAPDNATLDGATPSSGPNLVPGIERITERSRELTAQRRAAPIYPPAVEPLPEFPRLELYVWQQCRRRRVGEYLENAAIGADLGGFTGTGFSGMNHHSQFRCFQVVESTAMVLPNDRHQVTVTQASDPNWPWYVNACRFSGMAGAPSRTPNPSVPSVTCEMVTTPPNAGAVVWGSARYQDYRTRETYVRGCVNDCLERSILDPADRCGVTGSFVSGGVNATRSGITLNGRLSWHGRVSGSGGGITLEGFFR